MAKSYEKLYGLIILGNSGVGKSFLANILLGREAFKHEFSARSVTHDMEFQEITIDDEDYAIFNVPGLIEADQNRITMNKREIDRAFTLRPKSLIIYVFGHGHGRIHDEDVVAFNAINKAYPLNIDSLLLVINSLPAQRPLNYEGEATLLLQDVLNRPISEERICFLNHIDKENRNEREALRKQLISFIFKLSPREHLKQQDIHLQVDEVAMLKAQIKEMVEKFQQDKIHFQNEISMQQQRYDDLVAQQTADAEYFQRIIDQQAEESKRMKDTQEAQVQQMKERMQQMQEDHKRLTEEMTNKSNAEAAAIRAALDRSIQAQQQLGAQIAALQSRPPQVIYSTGGGGRRKSCFTSGTLVRMADGTDKPIEKIQVGDAVLGVDLQPHIVMFLDVEQLNGRCLYGINEYTPFFTSEHVFLTADGTMVAIVPRASENEEPTLRGLVSPLRTNHELQVLDQNRLSTRVVNNLTCMESDPNIKVYNVVLESGHIYYANGFCVFDMFPNLAQYPRMFKLLHLLWQNCATQVDAHFNDVTTPGSEDRFRLEKFSEFIQKAISSYLCNN